MRLNPFRRSAGLLLCLSLMGAASVPLASQMVSPHVAALLASVSAEAATVAPAVPTNLVGQFDGKQTVTLTWTDNASDETSQQIWMSKDGSSYTKLATVATNITRYQYTVSAPSGVAYYTVRAVNASGASGFSKIVKLSLTATIPTPTPTPTPTTTAPAAPSGLAGQFDGKQTVTLNWTDNANNETSEQLWTSRDGLNYTKLATLATNTIKYQYIVTPPSSGTASYYYMVRAVNAVGVSAFSKTKLSLAMATPTPTPTPTPTGSQVVTDVLNEVNKFRAQNGLAALALDTRLNSAAQRHSNDMAASSTMSHNCHDGTTMTQRITQAGYTWHTAAENVAAGQSTPLQVVQAWINSPGHRANMLNTSVKNLGVGYNNRYWTLDLAG